MATWMPVRVAGSQHMELIMWFNVIAVSFTPIRLKTLTELPNTVHWKHQSRLHSWNSRVFFVRKFPPFPIHIFSGGLSFGCLLHIKLAGDLLTNFVPGCHLSQGAQARGRLFPPLPLSRSIISPKQKMGQNVQKLVRKRLVSVDVLHNWQFFKGHLWVRSFWEVPGPRPWQFSNFSGLKSNPDKFSGSLGGGGGLQSGCFTRPLNGILKTTKNPYKVARRKTWKIASPAYRQAVYPWRNARTPRGMWIYALWDI